jgi:hypothetical protein
MAQAYDRGATGDVIAVTEISDEMRIQRQLASAMLIVGTEKWFCGGAYEQRRNNGSTAA